MSRDTLGDGIGNIMVQCDARVIILFYFYECDNIHRDILYLRKAIVNKEKIENIVPIVMIIVCIQLFLDSVKTPRLFFIKIFVTVSTRTAQSPQFVFGKIFKINKRIKSWKRILLLLRAD